MMVRKVMLVVLAFVALVTATNVAEARRGCRSCSSCSNGSCSVPMGTHESVPPSPPSPSDVKKSAQVEAAPAPAPQAAPVAEVKPMATTNVASTETNVRRGLFGRRR